MRRPLLNGGAVVMIVLVPALSVRGTEIDWTTNGAESGEVIGTELVLEGAGTHRLITLNSPEPTGDSYAVAGAVRYESIDAAGYLEMWSYFTDGGAFFSRTLATEGPMAALSGDSEGRRFELPFFLNGADAPERIEVNLVLPAGGTVWIGPLELIGLGDSAGWWTETQSGLVGAALGILAGLSGAVLGVLASRRKSRRLVEGILVSGTVGGVALLVVALVAGLGGQPRHVWYPLGLVGGILAVVDGALIPATRRSYQAAELTRIRALDA